MKSRLYRQQRMVSVGVASQQIAGPNPSRFSLHLQVPMGPDTPYTTTGAIGHAVSTAAAGVAQSFVVPAGVQAYLDSASAFQTAAGAVTLALQIVRGGVTITLQQFTPNGVFTGEIPLQAGDTVQWNVIVNVAATASDLSINIRQEKVPGRVTINLAEAAVLDQGIEVQAGSLPVIFTRAEFG